MVSASIQLLCFQSSTVAQIFQHYRLPGMEKKLINSGSLRKSTRKHSIYPPTMAGTLLSPYEQLIGH
jgi:hypothetical protein